MKKLLFTFLLSILTLSLNAKDPSEFQSAMNLFINLLDCPTEANMASLCKGHNLTNLGTENGFLTYSFPDGDILRCKIGNESGWRIPIVQVQTKDTKKEIEKILKKAGFYKQGKRYLAGSPYTITQKCCTISKSTSQNNDITFTKIIHPAN